MTSEYNEEIVVMSIKPFLTNLKSIKNVILNTLANESQAPYRLIETRKEIEKK